MVVGQTNAVGPTSIKGSFFSSFGFQREIGNKNAIQISNFTARRYASAVLAVVVRRCLSVTRRYCIKTAEQIKLIFLSEGFLRPIVFCILRKLE